MKGQMSIFDFLAEPKPGDWLDDGGWTMGEPLRFNDLQVGMIVWANKSTCSHEWWKCLRVSKVFRDSHGDVSRTVMEDGTKNQEYHSAYYQGYLSRPPHGEHFYRRVV